MICASLDVGIVKGNISRDHVHLLVSVPPTLAVSRLVQRMKGLTSRKLLMENRGLDKVFWGVAGICGQHRERDGRNEQDTERDEDADFKVEPRRPQSALADERKPTDI